VAAAERAGGGAADEGGGRGEAVPEAALTARLEHALALYRGEFLEGFAVESAPFETWLSSTREQVRREARSAARALALALTHTQLGDVAAAESAVRRWLALDPWDEAAHRLLMRLLVRQGQRAAALAQFESCRRRLAEELGVVPEPETSRLFEEVLAGDRAPEAAAAPVWPGLAPSERDGEPVPAFVARERELAALAEAVERALASRGGVFFVTGEPGSGKTALLAEAVRRAEAAHPELVVAWGQCSAFSGRGDPLEPFAQALRLLSGEAEGPPAARRSGVEPAHRLWQCLPHTLSSLLDEGPALLGRLVSGSTLLAHARQHGGVRLEQLQRLQRLLAHHAAQPGPPSRRTQTGLFEQFTRFFRRLSEHRPLVLVLDDLQWVDPGSAALLFHLARGLAGSPVLLACGYRAEEAELRQETGPRQLMEIVAELSSTHGDVALDLTNASTQDFVDALLDSEPNELGRDFRDRLFQRTAGNPLFTIELLRGMQWRGELEHDNEGRWVEGPALNWEALPARVEAVIDRRMRHLSAGCRDVLVAASVEGEQFTAEVAAAVLRRPAGRVRELLSREAGRRHQLVAAQGVRTIEGRELALYRFRHALYPTYLHNQLDAVERAELHGRVGRELARLYRPRPGRHPALALSLARHFEAAGAAADAIARYADAARHALDLLANAEAVDHLRSALRLLETLPPSPERDHQELELLLALGPPLTASKGWAPPELAAAYARVEQLCSTAEDGPRLLPALWSLSLFRLGRAEHAEIDRLFERMRRLADSTGEPALVELASVNVSPFFQGRFAEARRQLEEACARSDVALQHYLAHEFGTAPAVVARAFLAECAWLLGLPEDSERWAGEARAWAERVAHPMTSCSVLVRACGLAALRGDPAAMGALAEELHAAAAPHALETFVIAAAFFAHYAALRANPSPELLEPLRGLVERYHATGNEVNRPGLLACLAQACCDVGDVAAGLAAADESIRVAVRSGEVWFQAETWRIKGELLRRSADLPGATGSQPPRAQRERRLRAARACLLTARASARRQGAVALERRACESMASA
jgi:tetratricopeptide (TPR) repeat protein